MFSIVKVMIRKFLNILLSILKALSKTIIEKETMTKNIKQEDYDRQKLREELSRDEGREKFLYKDSVGKWTVGVGWNIDDKGLPENIIDQLLDIGISEAESDLNVLYPRWKELEVDKQRVLLNMSFNMGRNVFSKFKKFWAALNQDVPDYIEAAKEGLDSRWAKQVGPRADRLMNRLKGE